MSNSRNSELYFQFVKQGKQSIQSALILACNQIELLECQLDTARRLAEQKDALSFFYWNLTSEMAQALDHTLAELPKSNLTRIEGRKVFCKFHQRPDDPAALVIKKFHTIEEENRQLRQAVEALRPFVEIPPEAEIETAFERAIFDLFSIISQHAIQEGKCQPKQIFSE